MRSVSQVIECPHCLVKVHVWWSVTPLGEWPGIKGLGWQIVHASCVNCKERIARLVNTVTTGPGGQALRTEFDRFVYPLRRKRRAIDSESISPALKEDYLEACEVLEISPKASAVLSRRTLQGILKEQGYDSGNLYKQITDVLAEDGQAALPDSLRETIDVIRNFGNFSAHPITHETTLQLVDVEPNEADWCLRIIEELFRHYYVESDRLRKRIEETRAKIEAHGKELLPKED